MVVEPSDLPPGGRSAEDATEAAGRSHGEVYTVANVITVLRLALIPFFFVALLSEEPNSDVAAFLLFAGAASTDFLDGMIARRTGTVTSIGKVIDPLVDRLLIAMGVIGLYIVDRLPWWVVLLLVARDVYLLTGAWILERDGVRLPITLLGKITTAILLVGFSGLILGWPSVRLSDRDVMLAVPVIALGIVLSLTAAVQYTLLAVRARRASRASGPSHPTRGGGGQ